LLITKLNLKVWAGPLSGGRKVVLLLNRGSANSRLITCRWVDVGISPKADVILRDVWKVHVISLFFFNVYFN
jgi:Alpha galactosidase C-terminal beta sandwich domain